MGQGVGRQDLRSGSRGRARDGFDIENCPLLKKGIHVKRKTICLHYAQKRPAAGKNGSTPLAPGWGLFPPPRQSSLLKISTKASATLHRAAMMICFTRCESWPLSKTASP